MKSRNYQKDFDTWNEVKKLLDKADKVPEFKEREVWWCSLGANLGYEQDGKNKKFERPVLAIRKYNRWRFVGIPLTSQDKNDVFHYRLPVYNEVKSCIILSQARTMSAKRLIRRVRFIEPKIFADICQKYTELTVKMAVNKTKSPLKTGKSRTANADLYPNYSKPKLKSQAKGEPK